METALVEPHSNVFGKNSGICIVLLERNNKDLLQLKNQLSSYTCEPKTYCLYEQFSGLKERLDRLRNVNMDIIASLKRGKKMLDNQMEAISIQFNEFNDLQSGVIAYQEGVRNL